MRCQIEVVFRDDRGRPEELGNIPRENSTVSGIRQILLLLDVARRGKLTFNEGYL